ncbi:hypothetical protein Ahy_B06g085316 [Arachis hypogaea]|uniref:Uncharacterized protein n=1 Tax=Arachis hypogaea TaxID=3818 RepID=A0A444YU57_ARAHY|nr:hypothetical protein Ahy_B06g085316 [Arachis hypogaea]
MESSDEESDLDAEVDLAELRKDPPYVCSLLKKIPSNDKSNDSKLKNVRSVYPGAGDGLLDFLVQQKLKDRDVSLYPRCNAVFDVEVAEISEKERMKKGLDHKEEHAHQKQHIRRMEGQSSEGPQKGTIALINRSQAISVQWIRNC